MGVNIAYGVTREEYGREMETKGHPLTWAPGHRRTQVDTVRPIQSERAGRKHETKEKG